MPGSIRWRWSDEPFSYQKLCYSVPMLVFFGVVIASAFGDNWLPSSNFLDVLLVGLIAGAIYLFFLKVVWQLLPARIRARIPYDRQEAENSKGDVKSFREFCRVIFSKN
jgi:hypothetical protein